MLRTTILIRNPDTGLYLGAKDQWIRKRSAARVFCRGGEATAYALVQGLGTVQIVYAFPDARYDFALQPLHFPSETSSRILL